MSDAPLPSPPPPVYGPDRVPPNDGAAIAALILAIASFVICPVVPAIAALVVATSSRRNIADAGGALGGEHLCRVATVVVWVNIGLFLVLAVGAAVLLVAA